MVNAVAEPHALQIEFESLVLLIVAVALVILIDCLECTSYEGD